MKTDPENVSELTNVIADLKKAYTDGQKIPLNRWDGFVELVKTEGLHTKDKKEELDKILLKAFPGKEGSARTARCECRRIALVAACYEDIKKKTTSLIDRKKLKGSPSRILDLVITKAKEGALPNVTELEKGFLANQPKPAPTSDFRKKIIALIKAEQGKDELIWDGLNELLKAAEALKRNKVSLQLEQEQDAEKAAA